MSAYYNEVDPFCADWLRNLMAAGHIMAGEVDERDIRDVQPEDVRGFTRCHWFAGIAGWDLGLRLAGWPEGRAVWTGSVPCQPFSSAGAQLGTDDPRHLWPVWFRLIRECRPDCIFGEQVEAAIAHGWLDLVCDDLEGEGYAVGAVSLPACSVGAPHIRQRLWFVAESQGARGRADARSVRTGTDARLRVTEGQDERRSLIEAGGIVNSGADGGLADTNRALASNRELQRGGRLVQSAEDAVASERMADAERTGLSHGRAWAVFGELSEQVRAAGFWSACDWLPCRDGKARPVESGTFPLAYGVPGRVGQLRAYGNAIVAPLAAEFVKAYMEALEEKEIA